MKAPTPINRISKPLLRFREFLRVVWTEFKAHNYNLNYGSQLLWRFAARYDRLFLSPKSYTTFRRRMRTCKKCPIYEPTNKQCLLINLKGQRLGCGCYTPYLAKSSSRPCWAYERSNGQNGWE